MMRKNFRDLTEGNFGDYLVLKMSSERTKVGGVLWECICICGTKRNIPSNRLTSGKSTGCGCNRNIKLWNKRLEDLTGKQFGKLLVLGILKKDKRQIYWECRCACGNFTGVSTCKLKSSHTQSCGCGNAFKPTHRKSKYRIYTIWQGIHKRCNNSNCIGFVNYGARGISVCERWNDFENFYEDMHQSYKDNLSIDRINVQNGYYKENCRWATKQEQARNKTNTIYLTIDGERKRLMEWSELSGTDSKIIRQRVKRYNWSHKEAVYGKY